MTRRENGRPRIAPACSSLQAGPIQARPGADLRHATDVDFVPDPDVVVSAAQEIALMEADRIRSGKFTG